MRTQLVFALSSVLMTAVGSAQLQFDALEDRLPRHSAVPEGKTLVDVDLDGDLDIVVAEWGRELLWINQGGGAFVDETLQRLPNTITQTKQVAAGDVDGDGDPDLVAANDGVNDLYLNDGTGVFTLSPLPGSVSSVGVVLGDVDADGDLDLVFANAEFLGSQNTLLLNDGTGGFTDVTAHLMPVDADISQKVAMVDVDGDGDRDLVFANRRGPYGGGQNRLYLNDGNGTFTDGTKGRMPVDTDRTTDVVAADVDGDGGPGLGPRWLGAEPAVSQRRDGDVYGHDRPQHAGREDWQHGHGGGRSQWRWRSRSRHGFLSARGRQLQQGLPQQRQRVLR